MSLHEGGNSNIYALDLRSRNVRQLTNVAGHQHRARPIRPTAARSSSNRDRGGTQQIYAMGADGSNQQRISFGDGRYSTPVWSPDGKYIAFTKQEGGKFAIGVMKPDGSGERILTEGFHNEGPTWAPNGRVIMFFRDSRRKRRAQALFGGYHRLQRTAGADARASRPIPAWSPILN